MIKKFSFIMFCLLLIPASGFSIENVYPGYVVKFPENEEQSQIVKKAFSLANYSEESHSKKYSLVFPKTFKNFNLKNLKVQKYDATKNACLELKKMGALECSPNFELKTSATVTPNDPAYSSQWALSSTGINIGNTWSMATGNKNVVVVVLDTGVDYTHPDLIDNMWVNPNEIAGNGIDDDNNGFIDDVHGVNFINDTGNPLDDNGHGTHVAGVIGAKGNNATGITGVNWNTSIIALKFLSASGSGSLYNAVRAFEYISDLKSRGINIKIVNNSWGGGSYIQSLFLSMKSLSDDGVILTAAAGNDASDNDTIGSYPANFDIENLVSVAATTSTEDLAYFSNIGATSVDIGAPGGNILSTYPNNRYVYMSGTSMATPYVTGALALLLGNETNLTASKAVSRLYETGRDVASLSGSTITGRVVDMSRLLANKTTELPKSPSCNYNIENIAYDNENLAESQAVSFQADDYPYHSYELPFKFPFFGIEYSGINISANGVVYFGYTPSSTDYTNSSVAPTNSIATFHTDLIAKEDPYGVKFYSSQEKVVIFWKAKSYYRQFVGETGDVYVKLVLYPSGVIEDYISFYDEETINELSSHYTIGVSGTNSSQIVYATNDPTKLYNNLALRFTPQCEKDDNSSNIVEELKIESVDLYRVNNNKNFNLLKRTKKYAIQLTGTGSGEVQAKIGFEFGYCPDVVNIKVEDGFVEELGTLKIPVNYAKKLSISIPKYNLTKTRRIEQRKNIKYNKKQSKRNLKKICGRLMSQL